MEEDLAIPHDSPKNCNISLTENEKDKVKDFVYKHFKDVTDQSLFKNAEDSSIKDNGTSPKKMSLNKSHCKMKQGAVFSGKILSFGCSVCKDDSTYSPNDLLKHFRAVHKETLPTYPCDLCCFVTNEFPALQRHRIEHRNTLVTCELCNDDVQYSLLLLTRHYIMCHSIKGQFSCDWCEFTTFDAGTFVQHIHHHNESPWKCSKCRHISLNEEDHQKHMKAHSGSFPFTCQICGYGAARSEFLRKHVAAVHKEEAERMKAMEGSSTPANSSASLKLLLKTNGETQEAQRISKLNCLSGSLPNQNGRLIKPEISLEETHHMVDGTVSRKDNKNWSKPNTEQLMPLMLQEWDSSASSDVAGHTTPNGLTVLMLKNKISLPPNCTTKVMGFKMVDGKKHLVLKVITAAKQDSPCQNHSSVEDVGSAAPVVPQFHQSKSTIENGECSSSKGSTSQCYAVSPRNGSCIQMDQDDIMAVKVKIEEEETSVCNLDSSPHTFVVGEEINPLLNRSMANELNHVGDQDHSSQTTCSERCKFDATKNSDLKVSVENVTGLSSPSKVAQDTLLSKQISKTDADELAMPVAVKLIEHKRSFSSISIENQNQLSQVNRGKDSCDTILQSELFPPTSASGRENASGTQNSPSQEVFTFHNYFKDNFSHSPTANQNSDNMNEHSANKYSICKSSQFSLALPESPESFTESGNEEEITPKNNWEDMNNMSDGNSEFDECVVDDPTEEENPESVLQDFNIIKVEEDSIPISKKQSELNHISTSLGSFVEQHSDEIITQQLNKEKVGDWSASSDSLKPSKATLRILQLPESKQPLLLRTTDNRFAMPVQVNSTPGFKLISNSSNPQINVSYMKPGLERSSNPSGVSLPRNGRIGVSVPKAGTAEKGTALLSAVQTGASTTSNHYFINSPGFKGPVLLASTPPNTRDKTAKPQPTCYLVQRSLPFVQTPSTPGLRLASTQHPSNSQTVLAMPVSAAEKSSTVQTGRQAFLLRYISPPKANRLLNNQDAKMGTPCSQTNESPGNKVIFKIVSPTGSLLTSGTPTSSSQPLFLATRPQTQCFLMSSNKSNANLSNGVKTFFTVQSNAQKDVKESFISPSRMNEKEPPCEAEKPILAPRPIRPPSQRKRRRKRLFDELPATVYKARRLTNKVLTEKDTTVLWKPVAKEVERTLRLAPFSPRQQVRCPRRYQPVVVLNHPDADIPEVANIMKVVNRHNGAVTKVSLSQKTVQALSELDALGQNSLTKGVSSNSDHSRPRPVQSSVRERFLLKLKLRKKSKKKYEVVKKLSGGRQEPVVFDCWFCGRLFNSQEDWIGHGQRHLMEATRDWNKLF